MKNLLFLSPNLGAGGGGAERQIVTVACLLKDAGYNVEFACYCEGDFYEQQLKEQDITINWLIGNNYWKRIWKIRRFIRSGKYDVVISFLSTPNFLNCFAAIGGKSWKIITGERSAKEDSFSKTKTKIFAWFQHYADKIVCNSENARLMWTRHYPNYANKMAVIYNNVKLQPISSSYIPRKDGKLHIVIAASYQYLKNPIGLIKAISLMNENEKSKIHIDWFGKNDDFREKIYNEAFDMIKTNNLHNITLHPMTSEMHNIINTYDVCALFSSVEGLPNAICEGMKLGKPIIMSRVSDYNILVDDTNGFLCEWNNLDSIKDAILSAANLPTKKLTEMGNYSKHKAVKLFSTTSIKNKWISLIEG